MAKLQPYKHGYYLWNYVPSIAAAVMFCIFFVIALMTYSWRTWKRRTWFCIPMIVGLWFEIVGYGARAAAASRTGSLFPYAIQNSGILLAPALFAATIYMTLKRVILGVDGASYSLVPTSWLTRTFVLGDVVSFGVQGSAAGLMVVGGNTAVMGQWIVVAGLLIQVVMFGLFAITAGVFHWRIKRRPTVKSQTQGAWERTMHMLYAVSALIMVRSVFRVIEFVLGQDGYPLKHEWTLYVFDSVLMIIAVTIFWVWFPSDLHYKGINPEVSEVSLQQLTTREEDGQNPRQKTGEYLALA